MTRIISTFILMALFYVHARKKAVRNTPLLEFFFPKLAILAPKKFKNLKPFFHSFMKTQKVIF